MIMSKEEMEKIVTREVNARYKKWLADNKIDVIVENEPILITWTKKCYAAGFYEALNNYYKIYEILAKEDVKQG